MRETKELNVSPLAELPVELINLIALAQSEQQLELIRALSLTCKRVHDSLNHLSQIHTFLQAVIDDDKATVDAIMDVNPEMLLLEPPAGLVVKSKFNHHQFYAESALKMATRLKQIRMVKLLLSYYARQEKLYKDNLENLPEDQRQEQLEDLEYLYSHRSEALSAWKPYATQTNAHGIEEIIIPEDYQVKIQRLIEVFSKENFPNGIPDGSKTPANVYLSTDTESELSDLLDDLIPEKAVSLDKHYDAELLYLAALKSYRDIYRTLKAEALLCSFSIRVFGLIQRAFSQGTKKEFCASSYEVKKAIENDNYSSFDSRVEECELVGGSVLHAPGRSERKEIGFNYYGVLGQEGKGEYEWFIREPRYTGIDYLINYIKRKQNKFSEIIQTKQSQKDQHFQEYKSPDNVTL